MCLLSISGNADEVDKSTVLTVVSTNQTPDDVVVQRKFVELEKYNSLVSRMDNLYSALAAATIKIGELSPTNSFGRLLDLERKALLYETVNIKMQQKEKHIADLKKTVETANTLLAEQKEKNTLLDQKIKELIAYVAKMEKQQAPLKKTLDLIRLGQYEYYEIKKGDTCRSIAAQSTVYGDPEKHILIRQANRDNVADFDKLVPGEMLIIPRFSTSKRYEL